MGIAFALISSPIVDQYPVATTDDEPIDDVDPIAPYVDLEAIDVVTPPTRHPVSSEGVIFFSCLL